MWPHPTSRLFPYTTLFRSKTSPKYSNRLFENDGRGNFRDVTEKAGLTGAGFSNGVAVGDYDNDGHLDLFVGGVHANHLDRKSTRLNSSHLGISYAVFCLKK